MDLEDDKISNKKVMISQKHKDTHKEEEANHIITKINKEIMKIVKIMGTEGEGNITIKEDSKIIGEGTTELKINKKMNIKGK